MTERQKTVIDAARSTPARFVEIERLCRSTAERNEKRRWLSEAQARRDAMFEAERMRLVRTWKA
jgi:hypothetical protein